MRVGTPMAADPRSLRCLAALAIVLASLTAPTAGALAQTQPLVTIDDGPKKQTKKRAAKFAFSSDDPAATFECRLDASRFAPCASPLAIRGLERGRHVFEVRAVGAAGAVSSPAALKWKILQKGPR